MHSQNLKSLVSNNLWWCISDFHFYPVFWSRFIRRNLLEAQTSILIITNGITFGFNLRFGNLEKKSFLLKISFFRWTLSFLWFGKNSYVCSWRGRTHTLIWRTCSLLNSDNCWLIRCSRWTSSYSRIKIVHYSTPKEVLGAAIKLVSKIIHW